MCGMNSQISRRPRGRFNRFLALAAFSSAMLAGTAGINSAFAQTAMPVSANAIQVTGHAGPTPAWIAFCAQMPEECAYDASEPARIVLDQTTWKAIVEINERVNDTIIPVTDQDHWGVADRWDYPDDGLGDCEDIQLLKRRMLTEMGLPHRALRMTVVIDELGAGHAVLMARTDRGDFILDNKRKAVLPWQETGYRYVKREGSDNAAWVWLGNQAAPIVTATK
jgi:predicted transglutaminase-like cysteine proteinase